MKSITLTDPPSSWDALTKEQLIYIHELVKEELPESVYRMQVFLCLCDLELCGKSFFTGEEKATEEKDLSIEELNERLDWMEHVIKGDAPVTIVLQKKGDKDAPLMSISAEDFFEAVEHFTKFLNDPFTLTDCHLDTLRIGLHTYKAPDPMLLSLTYEQFQNAQSALSDVQYCREQVDEIRKEATDEMNKMSKQNKGFIQEDLFLRIDPQLMNRLENAAKELKSTQGNYISAILVPMEAKTMEIEECDHDGSVKTDSEGNVIKKKKVYWHAKTYNYEEMQRLKDEITEYAPDWLFPILHQWFQGSLAAQQSRFPKLFSGKGSGGENDPIKSFAQTLNTIMKEQGFPSQRAVLDTDAILNFETLNRLTIQAEEMERMNKRLKK